MATSAEKMKFYLRDTTKYHILAFESDLKLIQPITDELGIPLKWEKMPHNLFCDDFSEDLEARLLHIWIGQEVYCGTLEKTPENTAKMLLFNKKAFIPYLDDKLKDNMDAKWMEKHDIIQTNDILGESAGKRIEKLVENSLKK